MKRSEIEARTEELVLPILDSGGYTLWSTEYVKEGSDYYLRVYADKEGGITIDDCVGISRALEEKLDKEDFIGEAYILEVSSPGLTRKLRTDRDFENSIGRLVLLKLYKAENGVKEFKGTLEAFDKEELTINAEGETHKYKRENISSVRLEFE